MGIFKGFSFQLPVYSVVTPQTGLSYDVESLTVAGVNKLKTSLVTPNRLHSLVNDILWDSVRHKPDFIKTKEDFKKNVTTLDREALLYGLYHSTFGDEREFSATCPNCGHEQLIKVSISKSFGMTAYPYSNSVKKSYAVTKATNSKVYDPDVEREVMKDKLEENYDESIPEEIRMQEMNQTDEFDELDRSLVDRKSKRKIYGDHNKVESKDPAPRKKTLKEQEDEHQENIIAKKISLQLPVSNVMVVIRQPTIWDEEFILKDLAFSSKDVDDIISETIIIERFEEWKEGDKVPFNLVDARDDILYAYQTLPPLDRAKIFEVYNENFGKYCITIKSSYECAKCGAKNDLNIDITSQFFRSIAI